jgi:hypothetical protein
LGETEARSRDLVDVVRRIGDPAIIPVMSSVDLYSYASQRDLEEALRVIAVSARAMSAERRPGGGLLSGSRRDLTQAIIGVLVGDTSDAIDDALMQLGLRSGQDDEIQASVRALALMFFHGRAPQVLLEKGEHLGVLELMRSAVDLAGKWKQDHAGILRDAREK